MLTDPTRKSPIFYWLKIREKERVGSRERRWLGACLRGRFRGKKSGEKEDLGSDGKTE